jgi:hypothetical protein
MLNIFDKGSTLEARAFRGSERAASRLARSVALVIGIALCLIPETASNGVIRPIQTLQEIADYHLPDNQFRCHEKIVMMESSYRRDARNGSHWGYYQIRNTLLKGAPDDYQFVFYYKYVAHRYGLDSYNDEVPNYCAALNHLERKGWQ